MEPTSNPRLPAVSFFSYPNGTSGSGVGSPSSVGAIASTEGSSRSRRRFNARCSQIMVATKAGNVSLSIRSIFFSGLAMGTPYPSGQDNFLARRNPASALGSARPFMAIS